MIVKKISVKARHRKQCASCTVKTLGPIFPDFATVELLKTKYWNTVLNKEEQC